MKRFAIGMASGYAATICLAVLMPALALIKCSATPADGPGMLETPPPETEVSETYLIKEAQQAWAREFVWLFHSIIGDRSYGTFAEDTHKWVPLVGINGDHWSKTDQTFQSGVWDTRDEPHVFRDAKDWRDVAVTFSDVSYDPEYTDLEYGEPHITSDPLVNEGGQFQIVDNQGSTDVEHQISSTFSRTRTVTSEFKHTTTFDFKQTTETKVGGEYLGVSLEETLTLEFGQSFSDEETETKEESTSTEQTITDTTVVTPGVKAFIPFSTKRLNEDLPFWVNGVLRWAPGVRVFNSRDDYSNAQGCVVHTPYRATTTCYYNNSFKWTSCGKTHFSSDRNLAWYGRSKTGGGATLKWLSIDDLTQTFRGTATDWSGMAGYLDCQGAYVGSHLDRLNEPERRRIQLTGTQTRVADSSIEYAVHDISDESCDDDAIREAFNQPFEGQSSSAKLDELGCNHKVLRSVGEYAPLHWEGADEQHHRSVLRSLVRMREGR